VASAFARRIVFPALLVAGSVMFCVVALEVGLRVAGYPHQPARLSCYDPIIGNVYCAGVEAYPNNAYDSRFVVRINTEGMADREYQRAKPPGTLRIALLGDSVTASIDVRPTQKFKALWEDALTARLGRPVEILNFAIEGACTWDQLQLFHLRARHFQPDYVVLGFFWGNDVWNNGSLLRKGRPNPLADEYPAATVLGDLRLTHRRFSRWLWNHTYAYQFIRRLQTRADTIADYEDAAERAKQGNAAPAAPQGDVVYDPAFAWDSSDWELTRRLILKLKAESGAAGAKLIVFHIPMLAQIEMPRALPYREFREFLAANGIVSVDAFAALEALSPADRTALYIRDRVHLTVSGHRFIATTTAPQLLEAIQGR